MWYLREKARHYARSILLGGKCVKYNHNNLDYNVNTQTISPGN